MTRGESSDVSSRSKVFSASGFGEVRRALWNARGDTEESFDVGSPDGDTRRFDGGCGSNGEGGGELWWLLRLLGPYPSLSTWVTLGQVDRKGGNLLPIWSPCRHTTVTVPSGRIM